MPYDGFISYSHERMVAWRPPFSGDCSSGEAVEQPSGAPDLP